MLFSSKKTFLRTLFVIFLISTSTFLNAQCFEIESILVDACGSPESENEMVRFKVGTSDLDVDNMDVDWPTTSNSYDGICQNSTTSSKVSALNSTITGCGFIKEPSAGILPAGASVILFTSTLFDISANSFEHLNDTVYAIFQCPGNTAGHFSNSSSNVKTLTISFSSPSNCSDVVSYLPTDLIGGDGATVEYFSGTQNYINNGCTAPIVINSLNINESGFTICPGDTIDISATIEGNFNSTSWSGGNGMFSSTTSSSSSYYSDAASDINDFYIYLEGNTNCSNPIKDSILIEIGANNSSASITSATTELCMGDSILLTANGSGNYTWSTGSNSTSIYVSNTGNYSVTSNSSCGSHTAYITITNSPTINLNLTASDTIICDGAIANLTASGAPNYTWFNNSTATSQSVNTSGSYYVIGYNNCYRDSQSISINTALSPSITINSSSISNTICNGETISLTANGGSNYLWSTSDTSSNITVSSIGTYSVSSTNTCGTSSESITISAGNLPVASISGDTILCNNSITLTASGNGDFLWSTGSSSNTQIFSDNADVFLIVSNECGTDTAYKSIINYNVSASFTSDYSHESEIPSTINFTNTSSSNATSYSWDFGNNETSSEINPSTIYTNNGEYNVLLTASNDYCQATFEEKLIFERPNTIFIPNIFTPNNDGINDSFLIKGENISTVECKIFNRWGNEIYNWDTTNGYWDGTYQGKMAANGTYFYILSITWNNKEKEILTGHVSLLK